MEKIPNEKINNDYLIIIDKNISESIKNLEQKFINQEYFKNPEVKDKFLNELNSKRDRFKVQLKKLDKKRKKNTDIGRRILLNMVDDSNKLKVLVKNSNDISEIVHNIDIFQDKLSLNIEKVKHIRYKHAGITFTGLFLTILPYYNLLSIALGGYLLYSSDYRSKVSGSIILAIAIFMLLVYRYMMM
ncbi:MAG: hypothetical protein ACTSRP_11430 [Candidatus Helarchaeota archaeon]